MRILATIEEEPITELNDGSVTFKSGARIDVDGQGPHYKDPCAQSDTSLHWGGRALNADRDLFIVVPPVIVRRVKKVVLGCQAHVINLKNGLRSDAVVGDIGPKERLGEVSRGLALILGINGSPTTGGEDKHEIFYALKPGTPACVSGRHYTLQPS